MSRRAQSDTMLMATATASRRRRSPDASSAREPVADMREPAPEARRVGLLASTSLGVLAALAQPLCADDAVAKDRSSDREPA